jgi:hypothetical protein
LDHKPCCCSKLVMMESHNRHSWNILNWNIRGVNSDDKCNAVRAKIEEAACAIFCLQETKRQHFDHSSVRKLAPKRFSKYAFMPSEGTSGGILVGWNNSVFDGNVLYSSKFAITIQFTQPTMQSIGNSLQYMVPVMVRKGNTLLIGSTVCTLKRKKTSCF